MKKLTLTIILLSVLIISTVSQEKEETKNFKPLGKPFAKIYTNFHSDFSDGRIYSAFDLTRAYLGYGYEFSESWSAKANIDFGTPDVYVDDMEGSTSFDLTAYLKIAALSYKNDKLFVDFGMIGLKQFKLQEDVWDRRYLYKSFMDEHKFGPSADLGVIAGYKIIDMISVDVSILNGEGYKKLQADSVFKYGIGLTLIPIDGLTFRGYYDLMSNEQTQSTIAGFIGYELDSLSAGIEYNFQNKHKMVDNNDLSGISIYGSYYINKKIETFVRYDKLSSNTIEDENDPWNIKKDGQLIIAGIELSPIKGVKIAPNYQCWLPAQSGSNNISSFYINCELKF